MRSYSFGFGIQADNIEYGEMEFNTFVAREVIKNKTSVGEYHIKIKDNSSLSNAIAYFKRNLPEAKVGLIDPDNILNLEYKIYILISNPMLVTNIVELFTQLDMGLKKN